MGRRFLTYAGGKGANQAVAAARMGGRTVLVGQVGDDRLLVMASLLVADELSDAATRLDGLDESDRLRDEEALVSNIDTLAERIENIAQRLEQS